MLTGEKRQELLAALSGLDADELREASEIAHELRKIKAAAKRLQFHVGQRVEFNSSKRGLIQGVVTGIASVNVLVDAGPKGQWRVSAGVLQPVEG